MDNIFEKKKKVDSVTRFADFFDIQPGKSGDKDYVQQVKSTLSVYRTQQSYGGTDIDPRDISKIEYKVVGYDEDLKKHRVVQGLNCTREKVGALVRAVDLLKSGLAREKKPKKYVDEFGNIFEKV